MKKCTALFILLILSTNVFGDNKYYALRYKCVYKGGHCSTIYAAYSNGQIIGPLYFDVGYFIVTKADAILFMSADRVLGKLDYTYVWSYEHCIADIELEYDESKKGPKVDKLNRS